MEGDNPTRTKKEWAQPLLTVHGTVEELTQQCTNKDFGGNDGLTFQQQSVGFSCGS